MEGSGLDDRQDRPFPADRLPAVLAAAARGDQSAWRTLVHEYAPRVFALARSRLRQGDAAEEVTQSVMVTIAAKLQGREYAESGRFEAWLFRIAMNRIRDHIRLTRRAPEASEGDLDRLEQRPTASRPDLRDLGALRAALASLNDADREVILLRHHAGLEFRQMAQVLDEPLGTLLARHHRALRKLRGLLERSTNNSEPALGMEVSDDHAA